VNVLVNELRELIRPPRARHSGIDSRQAILPAGGYKDSVSQIWQMVSAKSAGYRINASVIWLMRLLRRKLEEWGEEAEGRQEIN
jgi:hypothetical protein